MSNGMGHEHQKLPICLEPTFRLLPRQSGSFQGISYPVQIEKNQKLIPLCAEHRNLAAQVSFELSTQQMNNKHFYE